MSSDRSPMNLGDKFLAVCVSFLLGTLMLNWAVCLVSQVWLQLTICVFVVVALAGVVTLIRLRRNRW